MKHIGKTALASAVGLALSCGATAATLEQYKMGTQSVKDLLAGKEAKGSVVKDQEQGIPSSYYVVLKQAGLQDVRSSDSASIRAASASIADSVQAVTSALLTLDRDAQVLATTKNLASGLVVRASADALQKLQANPAVASIYPVYDSKPMAADSAVYMKADAVVKAGIASGKGITVAVLDTGIDYTHKSMGGAGTVEAYNAVDQRAQPTWPQGKVLGGYDFVNNDPNPIDPRNAGHGTFVASSVSAIAPDVDFYGYTVCTATCPGAAQIGALDAALDPNGDGDISDRVDVINMSLGSDVGTTNATSGTQFLIQKAATLGINMVISAGNDGPNPFIVGGPSTTPNALSVGAMTHPTGSSVIFEANDVAGKEIDMVPSGFNKVSEFSFNSTANPLVFVSTNAQGCTAFAAGSLTGKTVLIDRGTCNFTAKVINAQNAGAAFVIIANNAAGLGPVNAGGSDPAVAIPSVGISKEDGDAIKAALASGDVAYSIVAKSISSAGGLATFTSRGPSIEGLLKPEITAPGTNIVMAAVGTGDKTALNSGTSFSGPMTAGAAALLREAMPNRTAQEVKATLMNTADMEVYTLPKAHPDTELAPISAMGAGLVNVEKAVNLPVAAWVEDSKFNTAQAALSFGLNTLTETTTLTKTVTLKNFGTEPKTYSLSIQDRFAADTETGALSWVIPETVTVAPGQSTKFDVKVTIDPTKLPEWELANTSELTEKNAQLTTVEYDGALIFNDATTEAANDLHLVYHILPRANAALELSSRFVGDTSVKVVKNVGAVEADVFATQLVGTSEKDESIAYDLRAASLDVVQVPTAYCTSGLLLAPTLTLENGLSHLQQVNVGVDLDIDNDGEYDHQLNSLLLTRLGANYAAFPAVMGTFVTPYGAYSGSVMDLFHSVGQRSVTLSACFEDIGLSAADLGRTIGTRYRTINDGNAIGADWGPELDDSIEANARLVSAPTVTLTSLSADVVPASDGASPSAVGDKVESLAPGEEARIEIDGASGAGVVLLSAVGDVAFAAETPSATTAPVMAETVEYSIDENSVAGTVLGQLTAETGLLDPAVAEFLVAGASSLAFSVSKNGTVTVADASLLDYEAGFTSAQLSVVAVNQAGNISAPATVNIAVANLPDAPPVITASATAATIVATVATAGTQVGNVAVTINEAEATLDKVTVTPALFTYADGKVNLARVPTWDEAGTVAVTVVATDSAGLTSNTATFNVTVAPAPKKSSGSFGWLSLMLLPLAFLRRRRN
ncbi:gammaproteobacterial enzyme C-terminal transmembrane domain protein [Rheinheimera sp. A13L]|uniref:S8 family serine peptidase n=1 Tax=Rheinheimera sp. A13L TaxID=506534 RepID=UPI0002124E51|nr:S8 family serine peptidase [Rheinheimera sp. A13L]EGM79198.1 gammaproteobacterial enzyme C-terminal transmembrane domain protein [Rheinheimera sp. A13L]